jgi:class 3 adenylate cyclase
MAETARVHYVFLDVVGFTKDRSVEAQSDVVATLNTVIRSSLATVKAPQKKTILLPTGDGVAIALINVAGIDTHLLLALHVLRMIAEQNDTAPEPSRRFEVRVGINENIDNLVKDVNGRRNVAGAGISMAQRIMDAADGGQILVGPTVFDTLRQREHYMSCFRAFTARGKHGITFPVYQFVSKETGLNVDTPSVFVVKKRAPEKLTMYAAYYFGHAIANRDFLHSRRSDSTRDYAAAILLSFLAKDSVNAAETPTHEEATTVTWQSGIATFEEQYKHYDGLEFWVLARFSKLLADELSSHAEHFEGAQWSKSTWLVKAAGVQKLMSEWPQVASELGITPEEAG